MAISTPSLFFIDDLLGLHDVAMRHVGARLERAEALRAVEPSMKPEKSSATAFMGTLHIGSAHVPVREFDETSFGFGL